MSNPMRFRLVSRYFTLVQLFVLLSVGPLLAQIPQRPQPQRLVNDLAHIFTPRQMQILEHRVVAFNDTTSNQIAIVTLPELYGYDKAQLAYEIGEKWGVGSEKFDNGIVILVKPKTGTSTGEVFIATGYGLEGAVTDAFARVVIEREMIPYFKNNDYYGGVNAALDVLMPVISGEISSKEYTDDSGEVLPAMIFMLFFILVVVLLALSSRDNNQNMGGGNRRGGRDFGVADAIILSSILSNAGRSRGAHGGFGGGSFGGGSFGGGGFGGFGGGSFGGGGAGGSW